MSVKFKAKNVEVNGVVVGTIKGWRNPNGRDHVPYVVYLANGQKVEGFAYCACARDWCRMNEPELAKLAGDPSHDVKAALNLV